MRYPKYERKFCEHCGQYVDYTDTLSKGLARCLLKIKAYTDKKGLNAVHLQKELGNTRIMTQEEVNNSGKLKQHGLLNKLPEAGNYEISDQGYAFLRGASVPKTIIIKKGSDEFIGFHNPEVVVTIKSLLKEDIYWKGDYFEIVTGEILTKSSPHS